MNESSKKQSWFDSFSIHDRESCARAIRNGGIAAMIAAGIMSILGIAGFFGHKENTTLKYLLDPWVLADAVLVLILGIFVFRKSRVASTLLVVYLIVGELNTWIDLGTVQGVPMALLFLAYYGNAMRGTYLWHSRYREPTANGARAPTGRRMLIGSAVGIVVTFVAFFAYALLYNGPELSVRVAAPESVVAGQAFQIELYLTNPHPEAIELDSIDIDEAVFEMFEVTSVTPEPNDGSPLSVLGRRSWEFDRVVHPGGSETVVFELQTLSQGTFQLPLEVCNGYQNCSGTPISVRVQ